MIRCMRFGSIEFPPGLLAARRRSRLVVFAGVAVSRLEPSCLPDFEGLVAEIAGNRLARLDPAERELGDLGRRFLGSEVNDLEEGCAPWRQLRNWAEVTGRLLTEMAPDGASWSRLAAQRVGLA